MLLKSPLRNEIASCEEAAYNSLPIKDACTLLFFTNRSELMAFAQQVGMDVLTNGSCTDDGDYHYFREVGK